MGKNRPSKKDRIKHKTKTAQQFSPNIWQRLAIAKSLRTSDKRQQNRINQYIWNTETYLGNWLDHMKQIDETNYWDYQLVNK